MSTTVLRGLGDWFVERSRHVSFWDLLRAWLVARPFHLEGALMALGGGKYSTEVDALRKQLRAAGIIVIVFDGVRGGGFEVQTDLATQLLLPQILRDLAEKIEGDIHRAPKEMT